ncbi:hypothetical protein DDE82_001428 [Stemphylium lycopersici]|nr:hypothetical protein DDE82_001428 [Stemphylium lycopersici]
MDPLNRLRRRMSKLTPTYLDEQPEPTYEEVCREITAINKQQSAFLRLPVSLRERIYGYVLGGVQIRLAVYYRLTDAQVSAIANIRVYFAYEDLIYYPALGQQGSSVNLSKHLMATLKVLGLLRGLRRITFEWAGSHEWGHEWPMVEGRVYFLITEELERIRGVPDIEVLVFGGNETTGSDAYPGPVVDDTRRLVAFKL